MSVLTPRALKLIIGNKNSMRTAVGMALLLGIALLPAPSDAADRELAAPMPKRRTSA